jgi:hypothetical protein
MNMDITIALKVINYLYSEFDSHDFIRKLLEKHPEIYGRYLVNHGEHGGSVATADGEISSFLARYASDLHITKTGDVPSPNILGHISDNAKWQKRL